MPHLQTDDLVLETCTCEELPPWHEGAYVLPAPPKEGDLAAKDGVNEWGRWHCMVIKGKLHRCELIEKSQKLIDAEAAEVAEAAEEAARAELFQTKKDELKAKKKGGGKLSSQDIEDLVDLMV